MSIVHHLHDATLMSAAAGALPPALAAVAASHVALCRQCRAGFAHGERIGAAVLADLAPLPVGAEPRMPPDAPAPPASATRRPEASALPAPLARLIAQPLDAIAWQRLGVGIWHRRVPVGASGAHLRLLKVAPGRDVPAHGHAGMELTLVLRGSYRDEIGRFGAGDIADLDQTIEHHPVADVETGCICVLASERPARFHGLMARLLQPLTGL